MMLSNNREVEINSSCRESEDKSPTQSLTISSHPRRDSPSETSSTVKVALHDAPNAQVSEASLESNIDSSPENPRPGSK